jgi:hypothetical protein
MFLFFGPSEFMDKTSCCRFHNDHDQNVVGFRCAMQNNDESENLHEISSDSNRQVQFQQSLEQL